MTKMLQKAVAILTLGLCLSGCIAAGAVAVYGVSRHRTHKSYHEYAASMAKTNQERQSQGLEPLPVWSFEDWKKHRKDLGKPEEAGPPAPTSGK